MPRAWTTYFTGDRLDTYMMIKDLFRRGSQDYKDAVKELERRQKMSDSAKKREEKKREEREKAKEIEKAKKKAEQEMKKLKTKITKQIKTKFNKAIQKGKTFSYKLEDIDKSMTIKEFIRFITSIDKKLVIRINQTHYVISDFTRERILKIIMEEITDETVEIESDQEVKYAFQDLNQDIHIEEFVPTNKYKMAEGAFFKYFHTTLFDFTRYGIFRKDEPQNHEDTCLIVALRNGGLDENSIEKIKLTIRNRIIPMTKLKDICEIAGIHIRLKTLTANSDDNKREWGKNYDKKFVIGLIDNHYFIVEPVKLTSYCLSNYETVKDMKDFNQIYKYDGKYYKRSTDRFIDSFDVVKLLMKHKDTLLQPMTLDDRMMASTQFYDSISTEIKSLEYDISKNVFPVEYKEEKNDDDYVNVAFDFETYVEGGVHIPYLVRTYSNTRNQVFYGEDCGLQMLRSLRHNTRLIAHNANYDYRFLIQYLYQIEELARGSHLISLNAKFGSAERHIKIQIKDSYHLITMPLRSFPKAFGLDCVKEVMPYSLYTRETIHQRWMNIEYVSTHFISEKDRPQFLENIKRWNLQKDDCYDIVEYSSRYCEMDCIILWKGYNIFRGWLIDCVGIDINNILTIASLAHRFFIKEGCYEGVNQLSGIPQLFIQGCVVGGRTMTARNEKISVEAKINDFDAVSLYPSAMSRMDGFLKGVPKIITNTSYDDLKTKDGYFVDIVVKSVGVERAFPLMSMKNENGIRIFSNDMVGKTLRVDKYTLEDLIQFQGITFDVVRGYYFDEGYNTKIRETIVKIFNERLKKKKEGNKVELVYKLIMNSGYGKSIMKPVETESRFFDNDDDFNVYLSRHYNWVKTYTKFGTKTKVKSVKTLVEHSNLAQVGVCILSMSKRIMNEVMCLAEDKGIDLYYQDTDSIHIKDSDIKVLADSFKTKYGRELIGKSMGQFHSDFSLKYKKNDKEYEADNIVARRSIFLGKKSYIDELVGTDEEGKEVVGYHIRMKGIPNSCLLHATKKYNYASVFDLYKDLSNGKKIEIDLTNDGTKANFKMGADYSVHTLSIFKRSLKF